MTVPNFLASSFYFGVGSSPITDVATIITDVRTILTSTNNPVWTEPVAGTFQSPVDSGGRFMRITLTRVTATRLAFSIQDQSLLTLFTREMDIPATAEVQYYTGQYHFYIEVQNGTAIADHACVFMLDPSPYGLSSSSCYIVGNAYRNSGGGIDGQGSTMDQFFMIESGAPVVRQRIRSVGQTVSTGSLGLTDIQGNPQIFPADIWAIPSGINVWAGKLYQAYVVPTTIGAGIVKTIALDDGTLASFRVLTLSSSNACSLALRVA